MDENNNFEDQGMYGGADLERGQETAKEIGSSAANAGKEVAGKAAGKGRDVASGIKDRVLDSRRQKKQAGPNVLPGKKKKKRIVGPDKKIKGHFYSAKGAAQKAAGRSLTTAGHATHAAGTATRAAGLVIKGAGTLMAPIPYVGPAIAKALNSVGQAADTAGKSMQKAGKKMKDTGRKITDIGKHNAQRGKILKKKGVDIGNPIKGAINPNISAPNSVSTPSIGSVISNAKRTKLSPLKIFMSIPLLKWFVLGGIVILLFVCCLSSSSRTDRGKYKEGDDGNVPYVVSNSVTNKMKITSDASGNLKYGFVDEEGKELTLDEAIDSALTTLEENDSNAYGDLGETDEERKEFLKKLILAELATQYPDLNITASGTVDIPEINNGGSVDQSGTAGKTVTIDDLTLDEKINQLLMVGVTLSDGNNYVDSNVGGYFFFGGSNYTNLEKIGSTASVAPFIATDDEGGQITRAAPGTPSAKSYGDSQNYDQLKADEVAKTNLLLSKGINLNLGPVTDCVSAGAIYDMERSYSSNYDTVVKCVATVLEARKSVSYNGKMLGSTLKHYPGYPNESANSDFSKCIDNRTADQVNASANLFDEGIRNGAQSVMVSNVVYTNVDSQYPASLSPTIVSKLRGEFNGVIMTDGLDAVATEGYADRYKRAIIAGNDMILLNEGNVSTAFNQIKSAVLSGEISEERINESVERILTMKRNLGILKKIPTDPSTGNNSTNTVTTTDPTASQTSTNINTDIQGKIKIQRKDDNGNVATLEYKDEATFNSMLSSGDPEVMKYYTLRKNTGGVSSSSGPANYSGSDNAEKVWNFLRSKGLSEVCTAAIMGNIQLESGFITDAVEIENGEGFGLCQWSFGRKTQIKNYAALVGKDPADIELQLDFLWMEIDPNADHTYANIQWGGDGYGWDAQSLFLRFTSLTDIDEATALFCWAHERPRASTAHLEDGPWRKRKKITC